SRPGDRGDGRDPARACGAAALDQAGRLRQRTLCRHASASSSRSSDTAFDDKFMTALHTDLSCAPGRQRRICFVTTEFHGLFKNGGIGTANSGLALALAEAGFHVTVAFADADRNGPRVKVGNFPKLQASYATQGITLDFVPVPEHIP